MTRTSRRPATPPAGVTAPTEEICRKALAPGTTRRCTRGMTQTPAPTPGTATLRIQYGSSKDYGSFGTLTVVHPHAYSRTEARRLAITRTDVATGGGRAVTVTFPNGAAYRFTPSQLHGYGSRPVAAR